MLKALVLGTNLMITPETSMALANMNFISQDSRCWSFDHRANGYGRGEGALAVLLKPLSKAMADGDMIRAVVRASGTNQDGHTPGLTNPSVDAQERLIRSVYSKAGLGFESTRYVEAHGKTAQLVGLRTMLSVHYKLLPQVSIFILY